MRKGNSPLEHHTPETSAEQIPEALNERGMAWQAASGAAAVERRFRRGGRSRKRGLEDGCVLVELRQAWIGGGA